MSAPVRTDTRPLLERRASVRMRIVELRKALGEAERCEAEIEVALAAQADTEQHAAQ